MLHLLFILLLLQHKLAGYFFCESIDVRQKQRILYLICFFLLTVNIIDLYTLSIHREVQLQSVVLVQRLALELTRRQ